MGRAPREAASGRNPTSSPSASPRGGRLLLLPPLAQRPPHAQREHAQQRRAPTQLAAILAVEGRRVARGLVGALVVLRAAGAAAALAGPAHRRALGLEAVPVSEHPTAQHESSVTAAVGSS